MGAKVMLLSGLLAAGAACGGETQGNRPPEAETSEDVPFVASLQGDTLRIEGTEPVDQPTCSGELAALTWSEAGGWQPIRDDRPAASYHNGFFADGRYVHSQCNALYCDVATCGPFRKKSLEAREYIADGSGVAPRTDNGGAACSFGDEVQDGREVPSFISRPAQAPVAARIRYYVGGCGTGTLREVIVEAE